MCFPFLLPCLSNLPVSEAVLDAAAAVCLLSFAPCPIPFHIIYHSLPLPVGYIPIAPFPEAVLDAAAAACLTRIKCPWTLGPVDWEGVDQK